MNINTNSNLPCWQKWPSSSFFFQDYQSNRHAPVMQKWKKLFTQCFLYVQERKKSSYYFKRLCYQLTPEVNKIIGGRGLYRTQNFWFAARNFFSFVRHPFSRLTVQILSIWVKSLRQNITFSNLTPPPSWNWKFTDWGLSYIHLLYQTIKKMTNQITSYLSFVYIYNF